MAADCFSTGDTKYELVSDGEDDNVAKDKKYVITTPQVAKFKVAPLVIRNFGEISSAAKVIGVDTFKNSSLLFLLTKSRPKK